MNSSRLSLLQILSRIKDWIRFAVTEFQKAELHYGHGTDNALDEAVYLVLYTLHLPLEMPGHLYDALLTYPEREKVNAIIMDRIHSRKPAAYLTRECFFMGLSFYVDERVLIPRSPFAELIEKQFQPWTDKINVKSILDLCTGSGCIAIACAYMFPDAYITASDISLEALEVAKINLDKHKDIGARVDLIQSDVFENISFKKYDLIISNPPYVDKEDMESLPLEHQHEPALALEAGDDGLNIITKILGEAKKYLADQGIIIIETGNSKEALINKFPALDFIWLSFEKGDSEIFLLTKNQLI